MSCRKHLTLLEREKLALALAKGQKISQIAKELCINRSIVYCELKRNTCQGEYFPTLAQQAYQKCRLCCRRKKVLADCSLYLRIARLFLDQQWYPQQIASRLRLEGTGCINYATIYRAIHAAVTAAFNVEFYFALPHHPWKCGTNENTNGLLQEYFPKSQDFSGLQDTYIQTQVNKLNFRPRKCLGYHSPYEALFSKVLYLT